MMTYSVCTASGCSNPDMKSVSRGNVRHGKDTEHKQGVSIKKSVTGNGKDQ